MSVWARSLIVSLIMTAFGALGGYWFAARFGPIGAIPCALLGLVIGTVLQVLIVGRSAGITPSLVRSSDPSPSEDKSVT